MLTFAVSLGGCAAVRVEVAAMAGERAEAVSSVRLQVSAWQPLAVAAAEAGAGPARSGTVMQHLLTVLTRWVCMGINGKVNLPSGCIRICSFAAAGSEHHRKAGRPPLLLFGKALAVVSSRVRSLPPNSGERMTCCFLL
jgi:hypothetical protein